MYKDKRILALILAKGGSKGLPGKNIRLLLDKPLIGWTIEQARNSKYVDRIVVSTNDRKIAEVSREYGAEIPFLRPEELARDSSPGSEAILHAMGFLEKENQPYDILVLLECTSPLRYGEDIDNVISRLIDNSDANSVVGVVESTNDHPLWAFKLRDEYMINFIPEASHIDNLSRQLLEKAYLPYSIYATQWNNYKEYKMFYQPKTLPYFLKREQKIDIDDETDFYLAECTLRKYLVPKG